MIDLSKSILYLRLPTRANTQSADYQTLSHPFAVAINGRLQREGFSRLDALSSLITHVQRVVMLPAASDVNVLRIITPPLSASKLKSVLPSLVEEFVLGDATDCQIVAGPDRQGERTVAVIDRAWLRQWSDRLRSLGAHRLSAKPSQLCLPLNEGRVSASVISFVHGDSCYRELIVRFASVEGIGLPLGEKNDDDTSTSQVHSALSTLAAHRPVDLELPSQELDMFQKRMPVDAVPDTEITLHPANWSHWIAGIDACDIDLMSDMMYGRQILFDQRRWRAAMVFAATLIALNISALNWDWWRLHREAQRLQHEIQSIYNVAFHEVSNANSVDPVKALAEMKKKRMTLRRSAGESSADDFLAMSAALGDAWPVLQQIANIDARAIASIEYRDASMELHLKPGLQFAIDTVRKVLSERGLELSSGSDMTVLKIRGMR
jgi:general secretion pathway protein L